MDHPESQIDSANAPRKRVRLFDTLRGFSVVSMVLFHFYYDLVFFIGIVPAPSSLRHNAPAASPISSALAPDTLLL